MIWKENGVCKGSYMCFFDNSPVFTEHYYHMISCGYFICDEKYNVNSKGMRPPILFYIINGTLEIDYENKHYTAGTNDIVLLNCYKPQQYYCTDYCEFLFFHYDGKTAQELTNYLIEINNSPVFTLDNAHDIYININEPIMKLCYQEQTSDAFLSSLVYSTLCMIPENCKALTPSTFEQDNISSKIITYIDQNISQNFTIQELADYVSLSPYYFSRRFKKETGHSPLEYVSIAKINYAKLMLRTTTISITEISEYLGYSSPASFINAFKSRRGISPNRYRNQIYEQNAKNIIR